MGDNFKTKRRAVSPDVRPAVETGRVPASLPNSSLEAAGRLNAGASAPGHDAALPARMQARFTDTFGRDRAPAGPRTAAAQPVGAGLAPLSTATAASAAGPMQAKKDKKPEAQPAVKPAVQPASAPVQDAQPAKPEKIESNGLFEGAFKGITSLSDKAASVAGTLSKPEDMRKSINSAMESAQEVAGPVGQFLGVKPLADGSVVELTRQIGNGAVSQLNSWGVTDAAEQVAKYAPPVGGAAAIPTAIMDFGGSMDKLDKAKESGSSSAVTNAQLDVASSVNTAVSKGAGFTKTVSDLFDSDAAKAVSAGAEQVTKATGFVGQGIGLIKDLYNLGESTQRKNSMRSSAEAMASRMPKDASAAEQERLSIFHQGTASAGQDQKQAGVSTVSHALALASAITKAAGAEPASAGVDIAKKAWDVVTGEVMDYEKEKFHTDTVEEKLHTKEAYEGFQGEDRLKHFHVSPEAYRKAQLRLQGYKSGSTDEAFEGISKDRAKLLTEAAAKKQDWAREYAGNAGIDTEDIDRSDEHREAVQGAFLRSLGGNKDAKFHSSNVLEYNAFKEAADENEAAKKRGFWGDFKYQTKKFGKATWESIKTGGKKFASAGKGVARGVKKLFRADTWKKGWDSVSTGASKAVSAIGRGAKRAAGGIYDFMTSADARKRAWAATKTGAVNAVKGIGRGAKYAWNVGKHSVTSRYKKIRDWYQEGVDQMNVHGDTYAKMDALSRIAWSAKNLPARIFYNTTKNKQATAIRFNRALTADEAAKHMAGFAKGDAPAPPPAGDAPSDIIHQQYLQAVADAQPGPEPERPAPSDIIHGQYEAALAATEAARPKAESPSAMDAIHAQHDEALAQLNNPALPDKQEKAPGSLLAQLEEQLRLLKETPI